ncbi:MAG: xanthine dehydrogenase family protein molybdopterin-binding subunit [Chloroflexia bacterium]
MVFEGRTSEQYVVVEQDDPEQWPASSELVHVGKPHTRIDGAERVTGRAQYTYDVHPPGMLVGKILRCPFPHARIKRIDTTAAEALPGVRAVISHLNAPRIEWYGDASLLFDTELMHEGDDVLAVAADDEDTARDALRLVEIEYEELPFVLDPERALLPDAPKVATEGNLDGGEPSVQERGDFEQGLAEAEVVVEGRYTTSSQLHNSLETHGSVVQWEGDNLTVWTSTQFVFGVRNEVAEKLGLPRNKVRVIKNFMGGGFGSKGEAGKFTIIAALLAQRTRRPVKIMLDRREENLVTGHRNPTVQVVKLGARSDGTLTAVFHVRGRHRAYGFIGPVTGPAREMYACPNVLTEEGAYTHTNPATSFRAPGYVEGAFALESAMDELAEKLGMSPLDLRMKNYAENDQESCKPYTVKELDRAYQLGYQAIGWESHTESADDGSPLRRGVGMASQIWGGNGGPPAHAVCKIESDGTLSVMSGTQDLGTGTTTMLAMIAAEELGMRVADVRVSLGDTRDMPYAPVSGGSMTAPAVGPAVRMAALEARKLLLDVASSLMEVAPEDLDIENGEVYTPRCPRTASRSPSC